LAAWFHTATHLEFAINKRKHNAGHYSTHTSVQA